MNKKITKLTLVACVITAPLWGMKTDANFLKKHKFLGFKEIFIAHLFPFLTQKEQMKLRELNNTWNNTVTLYSHAHPFKFDIRDNKLVRFTNFIEGFKNFTCSIALSNGGILTLPSGTKKFVNGISPNTLKQICATFTYNLKALALSLTYGQRLNDQITNKALTPLKHLENLIELNLQKCNKLTDTDLQHIPNSVQKLSLNNCYHITDNGLQKHLENHSNIRELDLSNCHYITSKGLAIIKNMKHLKTLYIDHCPKIDDALFDYLPKSLTTLSCINNEKMTNQGFAKLKNFPNLKNSSFGGLFSQIGDDALPHLPKSLKTLKIVESKITLTGLEQIKNHPIEELTLNQCKCIGDKIFIAIPPTVKTLNVSQCKITNKTLQLIHKLSNLKSLNLSYNENITDEGLEYLSNDTNNTPNLESLNLEDCENIEGKALKDLIKTLKNLSLNRCKGLSAQGIKNLCNLTNLETLNLFLDVETKEQNATIESLEFLPSSIKLLTLKTRKLETQKKIEKIAKQKNIAVKWVQLL